MYAKEIEEILKLLEGSDVSELEMQEGENRVRIVRAIGGVAAHVGTPIVVSHAPKFDAPHAAAPEKPAAAAEPAKGHVVTSPFVGTFYRSSSPTAAPYVEIGSNVNKGQIICIVEAMKLMNEIESDFSGKVTQVYVENGQPVEYGDKLFLVEP